ncbi:hypothetical protein SAMN05444672_14034 [Bacillus sp. OK838]|nr:hypothetical protein SAMN05444672_14034 [Bacillus sp. OK838]
MNTEELKEEIMRANPSDIYQKYLTGSEVWFFKEKLKDEKFYQTYDQFKRYINKQLNIGFNEIAIIGSAKVGFSFSPNPEKMLKPFHEKSDIDLVLVSKSYYEKFWKARLQMYYEENDETPYAPFAKNIFRKFIDMDDFPENNNLYTEWRKKVDPFQKHLELTFQMAEYDVNYRIFESWQVVEDYYISGISKVKEIIIRGDN